MEPGRERTRHARTICPAAEKCAAAVRIMRADLLGLLPADSCRFAVRASDGTCAAACIARTACVMCAARLLPRNRCAARLNSLPPLCAHVAPVRRCPCWPCARCRVAPVWLLRRGLGCRPSRSTPPPRARRLPGSRPLPDVLPPSALCVRLACVAAVVQRGPLSRYYMWITQLLLYNVLV